MKATVPRSDGTVTLKSNGGNRFNEADHSYIQNFQINAIKPQALKSPLTDNICTNHIFVHTHNPYICVDCTYLQQTPINYKYLADTSYLCTLLGSVFKYDVARSHIKGRLRLKIELLR